MLLKEKLSFQIDPISNLLQEQKKPLITFSYVSPVGHSHMSPFPSHFGRAPHTTHIEKVQRLSPFQGLQRQDGNLEQEQRNLRESYRRKRIFENGSASIKPDLFSKEQQVNQSQQKIRKRIKSVLHYSEYRQKKKRNNIFQDYNPKATSSVQNQPIDPEPDHLFPLHKHPHPQSLVQYVDLGQHRKERAISQKNAKGRTYVSEIKKRDEQDLVDFRVFQKGSLNNHKNKNVSEFEFDESSNACSHREINKSKEEFGELLQSVPRFYDRADEPQLSPIPKTNSYVDIRLLKSSESSGWGRHFPTKQVKQNNFSSTFLEKAEQIVQKVLGNKNTLPLALITLGLILLLIQIAK